MIFSTRKTIGVFLSKMFAAFDSAVFNALAREGKRRGYDIVVFTTAGYYLSQSDYDIQEKNIFRFAAIEKMDGIIIVPDSYEQGEFRDMLYAMLERQTRCPVIALRHDGGPYDCVCTDETQAIRPVIRHLIEKHGLRKICFQTGFPGHTEADARRRVFEEEMAAHGLTVPPDAICAGNMWINCGQDAYRQFFSDSENVPEAVVCANDYMAVGLIRVLREHGWRVPEDVIVTGFDNIQRIGMDVPSLTTVQPDYDGMVVAAMDRLDSLLREGQAADGPVRISLEGRFTLGESCGCGCRPRDYFRDASIYFASELELINDQETRMNNMSIDLGACRDLPELHSVLLNKRSRMESLRDFYLVLFGEPGSLMQEAGSRACLVHAMRDKRDCGMPMVCFDRGDLLPPMAERLEEPQMLFVKMLHERGHNFGYSVIQYVEGKTLDRTFVQSNALLSIALENIYRGEQLMRLYEERRLSSITDLLTGLLNRRGLMEQVEPVWHGLLGQRVAFVCMDMDHLKQINDTYGHAAGDFAIRLVGSAIQKALPQGAAGARIGGDEFVVFLPEAGSGEPEAFLNRFQKALEALNLKEDRTFTVTASAGFAVKRLNEMDTVEHCIQLSDRELYKAKEARRTARSQ